MVKMSYKYENVYTIIKGIVWYIHQTNSDMKNVSATDVVYEGYVKVLTMYWMMYFIEVLINY